MTMQKKVKKILWFGGYNIILFVRGCECPLPQILVQKYKG